MAEEPRREWFEKDYYSVLGVPKNATAAEIKKAYRKLAQQHHPDTRQGDADAEDRFKEISAAYDVLGDEGKRKAYDRVREMSGSGFGPGFGRGAGGQGWPGAGTGTGFPGGVRYEQVDVDDLSDLFGGLFGGAGRRGSRREAAGRRGADLETEVSISFEEAMSGTTVPIKIDGPAVCSRCRGSGAEPGTTPVTCPRCGGSGEIAENQGFFSMSRPCPTCGGAGRIVETPCTKCDGSGAERRTRTLQVKMPAGVRNGARIRLAGKGEPGVAGGAPGDLYVKLAVKPHTVFGRRGDDLTVELPITYPEAALGANVEVPTMNGPVTLKVPAGTPSGKTFRVKGRGAPRKGGRGDLLAKVMVDVPSKVSGEEKELLRKLRDASKESPRKRLGVE
ncbi:MAG TPA: molecular chaperone DnaJ [Actinomycetota bacterium]|nr:molecular chaperone DnaJ [Actinomycetota bacterium]